MRQMEKTKLSEILITLRVAHQISAKAIEMTPRELSDANKFEHRKKKKRQKRKKRRNENLFYFF